MTFQDGDTCGKCSDHSLKNIYISKAPNDTDILFLYQTICDFIDTCSREARGLELDQSES